MTTIEIPFLRGDRLYLRSLAEADVQGPYLLWFNDKEVCWGNSHHIFPFSANEALNYVQHSKQTRDEIILAIVLYEGDQHIGNIALQSIHSTYRSSEFSIIIGDRKAWGKGYGKEAAELLFDHGFNSLNLNRIGCGTFESNTGMKRLALSLGMKEEGRRREAAFKNGRYLDVIEYGILKNEYEEYSKKRK